MTTLHETAHCIPKSPIYSESQPKLRFKETQITTKTVDLHSPRQMWPGAADHSSQNLKLFQYTARPADPSSQRHM